MFDTANACMYICTYVLYVYVKYENAKYVNRICILLKKHIIAKYDLLCIYMCKNKCMYIIYMYI